MEGFRKEQSRELCGHVGTRRSEAEAPGCQTSAPRSPLSEGLDPVDPGEVKWKSSPSKAMLEAG